MKDHWHQNGGLRVDGSVQYSESLTVQCNGGLTVALRGKAGKLVLHANGELVADLVALNAPVVEVRPNGPLFLRVGAETKTVKIDGNAVGAVILTRGNGGLKVEGVTEHTPGAWPWSRTDGPRPAHSRRDTVSNWRARICPAGFRP